MTQRHAARTVLLDTDGQVAIIQAKKLGYYKIPGGGIEEGEDSEAAAKREAREESGCEVEILSSLGQIVTDLPGWEMQDVSDGFLARAIGEKQVPTFEEHEIERGFDIGWYDLDEAIRMIETTTAPDFETGAIQARDLEFVKRAKKWLEEQK